MFGHFNQEELTAAIKDRMTTYLREADQQRHLPRHSFRRRIAQQLRAWAEALEPTPGFSRSSKRLHGA
ncbi:hypothetical protein [uncultured Meiothermus sp.]|jgi:hypothetical protein|uniref:hypothetical protein n=1 Tax=uncultured Meiothermus sp. TaxID=157471 RepID=UPI00262A79CD|nr:hypothetical protein [uncultured Meiothermus sp.]